MVKRGSKEDDVSNKVVLVLAVLVVLIVASSTWLVLDKLSGVDNSEEIQVTKVVEQYPPSGGVVGLTLLSPSEVGGESNGE